ncbi:hypothetical protein [Azospirillum brasilense]|uniref:hypothetical protein n=1 Tax=Azospirillum brasilense TaxID=192 RepID=UPI001EDA13A8|nr:hypothetical protein [Azospirillum brasilense]UKJ76240.1 hypothetical protein H1Q64_24775 [Azospirillum brasilense]
MPADQPTQHGGGDVFGDVQHAAVGEHHLDQGGTALDGCSSQASCEAPSSRRSSPIKSMMTAPRDMLAVA